MRKACKSCKSCKTVYSNETVFLHDQECIRCGSPVPKRVCTRILEANRRLPMPTSWPSWVTRQPFVLHQQQKP